MISRVWDPFGCWLVALHTHVSAGGARRARSQHTAHSTQYTAPLALGSWKLEVGSWKLEEPRAKRRKNRATYIYPPTAHHILVQTEDSDRGQARPRALMRHACPTVPLPPDARPHTHPPTHTLLIERDARSSPFPADCGTTGCRPTAGAARGGKSTRPCCRAVSSARWSSHQRTSRSAASRYYEPVFP